MSNFLPEESKRKSTARLQGMMGVFMGFVYILIAGAVTYMQVKGLNPDGIFDMGVPMTYVLIVVFVLYGIFRMYRASKLIKSAK